jgi:DNA-binding NarL/FixJ family response regulator
MLRVLVVDKNRINREKFSSVLSETPGVEVLAECETVTNALSYLEGCDVALISTNLPDDGAFRLTYAIAHPTSRTLTSATIGTHAIGASQTVISWEFLPQVLIVGVSESHHAILRYIEAGAKGYVSRNASVEELLRHVRSVYHGKTLLSPSLAAVVISRLTELATCFEEIKSGCDQIVDLTPREQEVLNLLGQDYSNLEIANQLIIEVGTVKNHVHNILTKLNVSNRREAATFVANKRSRNQAPYFQWRSDIPLKKPNLVEHYVS